MTVSVRFYAPQSSNNEHISRHTGRPTGRRHISTRKTGFFREHISRHTGRGTGRPHIKRSYSQIDSRFDRTASLISVGILLLISGIALGILGIATLNPILTGFGFGLMAFGITGITTEIALQIKEKKDAQIQPQTAQNPPGSTPEIK